jgi:S-adenosylmethionine decarboxylase
MTGREWIVDAFGCSAESLRDPERLQTLFAKMVTVLGLHPVHEAHWHQFPAPGGYTGFQVLQESHLACHTFPEHGSLCLNLFCCQPRPEFNYVFYLAREFGAESVRVRRMERPYGKPPGS